MKTCTKCHIEKDETEFNKDKHAKSGLKTQCRACIRSRVNVRELNKKKVCTICKVEKQATEFNYDNHGLYGVRADCKVCFGEQRKLYKQTNPADAKKSRDKYNHSVNGKINNKKWRESRQGKAYTKKYRSLNRERINLWHRKYRTSSILRHLYSIMSGNISNSLKVNCVSKNKRKWETLAGYTVNDLKAHMSILLLEKGWKWAGLGIIWEIDHKRPVSWFNFSSLEDPQIKECWALSNLQPLLIADNRRKLNRWSDYPDDIASGRSSLESYFAAPSA